MLLPPSMQMRTQIYVCVRIKIEKETNYEMQDPYTYCKTDINEGPIYCR